MKMYELTYKYAIASEYGLVSAEIEKSHLTILSTLALDKINMKCPSWSASLNTTWEACKLHFFSHAT